MPPLLKEPSSGRTEINKQWGTIEPRRRKHPDFVNVYYTGVHNRSGGIPPSSPVIRAWSH